MDPGVSPGRGKQLLEKVFKGFLLKHNHVLPCKRFSSTHRLLLQTLILVFKAFL